MKEVINLYHNLLIMPLVKVIGVVISKAAPILIWETKMMNLVKILKKVKCHRGVTTWWREEEGLEAQGEEGDHQAENPVL